MSDPVPFDRGRRRRDSTICEVPGCDEPTIGPLGSPGNTPIVYPCAKHAREKYGTDNTFGVISVLLGGEPMTQEEAIRIWREARRERRGLKALDDDSITPPSPSH